MGVVLELAKNRFSCTDLVSVQALERSHFGSPTPGKRIALDLEPEEALYLVDVRNAQVQGSGGKRLSFNEAAAPFVGDAKFLARYFAYRDWRDRGVVPRPAREAQGPYGRSPLAKYPSQDYSAPKLAADALFFADDLMSVVGDDDAGRRLYEEDWFGQYGTYKAKKHGRYCKLDAYETLFLLNYGKLSANVTPKRLLAVAKKRRPDFESLYAVYEDWRLRGYVLKTGFKFGTHFRLYFPGAKPTLEAGEWMHSQHVIHVFPRESKLLISEWARAIRVAHGVRKTFILAIPGQRKEGRAELDFLLYHRVGADIETPKKGSPAFAMLALSEEEEIGGEELAQAIATSKKLGLDLLLAIVDRETAVTYYRVKRVELPKSKYEYYEIEWTQP